MRKNPPVFHVFRTAFLCGSRLFLRSPPTAPKKFKTYLYFRMVIRNSRYAKILQRRNGPPGSISARLHRLIKKPDLLKRRSGSQAVKKVQGLFRQPAKMPLLLRPAAAQKSSPRSLNALLCKAFRVFDSTRGGLPPPRAPPPKCGRIRLNRGF